MDDISVTPESSTSSVKANRENKKGNKEQNDYPLSPATAGTKALQMKYALLLNTQAEEINNLRLFQFVDDWYGTRYCLGGTTKTCIDCSGFVQTFFSTVYGIRIPRTAKEQYGASNKISTRKLKQGDLLFFNTRGGVSHVGIYLQNKKFVHASTNNGVVISDMSEGYYEKRFIGAGRIDNEPETTGRK
ncbi:MAG: NlpC/P60 family protein [Bacteroidota bacterium]